MKPVIQIFAVFSVLLLIAAGPSGLAGHAAAPDTQQTAPETAPADDPAAVAALRKNRLVRYRLNAQGNVEKVECEGTRGGPAMELRYLQKLSLDYVETLHMEALKQLKGLHSVRILELSLVTDGELVSVKDLVSLEQLRLLEVPGPDGKFDNQATDAGLANLRGLKRLRRPLR